MQVRGPRDHGWTLFRGRGRTRKPASGSVISRGSSKPALDLGALDEKRRSLREPGGLSGQLTGERSLV